MEKKNRIGIIFIIIALVLIIPCINLLLLVNSEISEGAGYYTIYYFPVLLLFALIFIFFLIGTYKIIHVFPPLKKKGIFAVIFGFFVVFWFLMFYLLFTLSYTPPIYYLLCHLIFSILIGCPFYIQGVFYIKNYKRLDENNYGTKKNILGSILLSIGILFIYYSVMFLLNFWIDIFSLKHIITIFQWIIPLIIGFASITTGKSLIKST